MTHFAVILYFVIIWCSYSAYIYCQNNSLVVKKYSADKYRCVTNSTSAFDKRNINKVSEGISDLLVISKNEDSISLRWKPPEQTVIEYYIVLYKYKDYENRNWKNINIKSSNTSCKIWPDFHCIKLRHLINDKCYKIKISYRNEKPQDFSQITVIASAITKTEQSEAPYDLKAYWALDNNLNLKWKHPNVTNGEIGYFDISVIAENETHKTVHHKLNVTENSYNLTYHYKINSTKLSVSTNYTVKIFANNNLNGKEVRVNYFTPPSIPLIVDDIKILHCFKNSVVVNILFKIPKETEMVNDFELFVIIQDDDDGSIGSLTELKMLGNKLNFSINKLIAEKKLTNFQRSYSFHVNVTSDVITVIVRKTFNNQSSYKIYFLQCTTVHYLFYLTFLPLFLLPVAICSFFFRKNRAKSQEVLKNITENIDSVDEIYSKTIQTFEFENYVKESLKNGELIRQHTVVLNNISQSVYQRVNPKTVAKILCLDYVDIEFSDGTVKSKAYLVTEIPMEHAVADFWKMIWEENIEFILLLDVHKTCEEPSYKYWPKRKQKMRYKDVSVELALSADSDHYEQRIFIMTYNKQIKHVNQFHLKIQNRHGIPLYSSNLLQLFKKILKLSSNSKSSILVHSSDGYAATGFALLCDMSLRMIKKGGVVDILKNLKNLGDHNIRMINNFDYYKLAHFVVLEYLFGSFSVEKLTKTYENVSIMGKS